MGAGNCMGRTWEQRASRNHVSGPICSGPVRLYGSVLKTKQLGLANWACAGSTCYADWASDSGPKLGL